jgi:hypothetical protein
MCVLEGGEGHTVMQGSENKRLGQKGDGRGERFHIQKYSNAVQSCDGLQAAPESPSWARILADLEPLDQGRQQNEGSFPEALDRAVDLRASWPASKSFGGNSSAPAPMFRWGALLHLCRQPLGL